jgi:carbon storage regulator
MLVLTRHAGEQLVIADDIVVTVICVEGNKVRLGISAPKSVRVDRAEIHSRRLAERASCAGVDTTIEVAAGIS